MAETPKPAILFLAASLFFSLSTTPALLRVQCQLLPIINEKEANNVTTIQTYIVHVQKPQGTRFLRFRDRVRWYMSFLPNATLHSGETRMVYAYRHVISGFAARLSAEEAAAMEAMAGFVLAFPENVYELKTTYTPTYLGLNRGWGGSLWDRTSMGQGQVIGVIDSGIHPTHPSFRDAGMPPPPPHWSGNCYWGRPICNFKLIGAVGYRNGWYINPSDDNGHGTHVASTAAGNFVDGAEVIGMAHGTASGMAPRAHLAIYKVLHDDNGRTVGTDSDILQGIDQAIRDGVDVLQMSLGASKVPLYEAAVNVGSFAAITRGIVPCAAAANEGPLNSIIANDAPWVLTVGASAVDRRIQATVTLGNGMELHGEAGYQPDGANSTQPLPLVYPGDLNTPGSTACNVDMTHLNVRGKIVLCWGGSISNEAKARLVRRAGGAAMIVMNTWATGDTTGVEPIDPIPTALVPLSAGQQIMAYFRNSANPTAMLAFVGTKFGAAPSPAVASFSSRGPSLQNGGIIKPDVIAPGVNILAAWPSEVGPNPTGTSKTFNFLSGTSMATPHVSGIVGLLRNSHPTWSPAVIKSAIMTTARRSDDGGNPIADQGQPGSAANVFAMGSGHVDPVAADDPGLVYDLYYYNYVHYLCGLGYSDRQVQAIIRVAVQCSQVQKIRPEDLNYPSISVYLTTSPSSTTSVRRVVTNVGDPDTYAVQVEEPQGVRVDVNPTTLQFSGVNEKQVFTVTFTIKPGVTPSKGEFSQGQLSWVSGKYLVRSPIAVTIV